MDYGDSVDDWASVGDDDDDFCYGCDDWTEDDGHGNCKECGVSFKTVDPFISPSTAKIYSSPAPAVSAHGDVWGRGHGSGYTWGGGASWWGGSGSYTSAWGGGWSSTNSDRDARMLKHKRHLDSLCKVVDPTVKHTLNFATGKSYSNMNTGLIYVDGSLLRDDDDKLDVVAGLSIHEKLHLVHTQPLIKWERLFRDAHSLSGAESRLLHNIGNIVEDEYIEAQLAKTHAGYVNYIQKVKEHYFDRHGEKIEACKDPFGDVLNTLLALVRFPQAIDAERKKRHAKHIQFFVRALKDGLKSRDNTLTCIESLYDYMRQLAKKQAEESEGDDEEAMLERATEELEKILSSYREEGYDELSDEDKERMLKRLLEDEKKTAERHSRYGDQKVMERGVGAMASELADYEQAMGTISDDLAKAIAELEDSDYTEEDWDKAKALGLKVGTKVTWRNEKADTETYKANYDEALRTMKGSISGLRRRIDLYGDTKIYTIRNQRRGKLDKKMLHKIPLGREDLFKNVVIDEDKPLDVCLLVDESGSMGHAKMKKARETAIALREALKDNQALNLWVFGHTADGYGWDGLGQTNMSVYWSPSYKHHINAMGSMRARSENKDGMAILASADRVKAESPSMSSNKLMIVISDGEPSADKYRGYTAQAHVKKCVKHLEGQGWSIIQIGIQGAREYSMKEMFTNYIYVEDTSQLPNQVSRIIRKVIKV